MVQQIVLDSFDQLQGVFDGVQEANDNADFTSTINDLIGDLEDDHNDYFMDQEGPDGRPWPDNSIETVIYKRLVFGDKRSVLIASGDLWISLTGRNSNSIRNVAEKGRELLFGTSHPHSDFLTKGGLGRSPLTGRPMEIPGRTHVGMTEERLDKAVEDVANELVKQLAGERNT